MWQTLAEASDLFEQAGQAFRDGSHAEAIRLALLALIARLEKQGLLRYDTTRTNREYQRELRPWSELAACFGQLARIYERVWYGRVPAGRAEAEQAIRLCGIADQRGGPRPLSKPTRSRWILLAALALGVIDPGGTSAAGFGSPTGRRLPAAPRRRHRRRIGRVPLGGSDRHPGPAAGGPDLGSRQIAPRARRATAS